MDLSTNRLTRPGRNCWRIEQSHRFAFIVDADTYFTAVRQAMLQARRSILMIGWDFDARIELGDPADGGPAKLGDFVRYLADRNEGLQIRLLRWDTGALKAMFRGNTLLTILRWKAHPRITLRLDGKHPIASSHHQKIVVIDDCLAFCGGIDMTEGRWDTRDHRDNDPRRVTPSGQPLKPWHDATSAFDGPAARALGDLARERWNIASGQHLAPITDAQGCWPEVLEPEFRDKPLAIARTRPEMDDVQPSFEIEQMYLDLVERAKRVIYAESQYFASRRVAQAIARRLVEEDPPEIIIVTPVSAQGWLEPIAMDSARAKLFEALKRLDHKDRLRLYHPVTDGGEDIYVHAKVTMVDDQYLRVGSSNFNNRSMRLDTECDIVLAADRPGDEDTGKRITALRDDLLAEHLGLSPAEVTDAIARHGRLIPAIEENLRSRGQGRTLVPYELPELNGFYEWLAENEILDPDGPDQIFEAPAKRGLRLGWFRKLRSVARRRRKR
ncbi:phospholipase D-like domain-containing protein [Paracoccus sp. 1_MG-2023]|uniref:phospholipase D-like domain-containing protein n=1 Tax=unclassified Paracoccus (in: a-proteobacteria) TaxID=2688777 RepID=UPI001C086A3E|nr:MULTISPECIES: phospholipase D-like domain-containing protein [unclassified Paracoccus (in: a-proteobacteria)]MBU2957074.1 phospholipase [Paracoccus sp. C2R09]MDO6669592.1 phospholipase D-like domain-containing protein [Paracoccus sp. 1_MG-2023]